MTKAFLTELKYAGSKLIFKNAQTGRFILTDVHSQNRTYQIRKNEKKAPHIFIVPYYGCARYCQKLCYVYAHFQWCFTIRYSQKNSSTKQVFMNWNANYWILIYTRILCVVVILTDMLILQFLYWTISLLNDQSIEWTDQLKNKLGMQKEKVRCKV